MRKVLAKANQCMKLFNHYLKVVAIAKYLINYE
jgi:hypothetical protein